MAKKKDQEYKEAMARLKKVQAKYVVNNKKKSATIKDSREWEKKRKQRYQDKVWRGWRETDGKPAPVTVTTIKELEDVAPSGRRSKR
jgi:hypothetical protein